MKYVVKNKIRIYRFNHGELSQEQLANLVCVSRQTINAIEKEKYAPSLELAFKIAKVFDAKLEEVFSYTNE